VCVCVCVCLSVCVCVCVTVCTCVCVSVRTSAAASLAREHACSCCVSCRLTCGQGSLSNAGASKRTKGIALPSHPRRRARSCTYARMRARARTHARGDLLGTSLPLGRFTRPKRLRHLSLHQWTAQRCNIQLNKATHDRTTPHDDRMWDARMQRARDTSGDGTTW
jgi:hypothetical protein